MKKTRTVLALMMFSMIVLASIPAGASATDFTSLGEEVERMRKDSSIPSIQVSVVQDGKDVWTKQFGNESVDATYMIGSVQKIFTAIAILQLKEQGNITFLDDDVSDYLPFEVNNPKGSGTPVTFEMLLSHRSGLGETLPSQFLWDTDGVGRDYGRYYNQAVIQMDAKDYMEATLSENGTLYSEDIWIDEPGKGYYYSPAGYQILMYLIENIAQQNISAYMTKNIFAPLKMSSTSFSPGDTQARPHTYYNGEIIPLPRWTGKYMIRSTSSDMAKLLIAMANNGEYNGSQILTPESVKLMRESNPNQSDRSNFILKSPEHFSLIQNGYGYGWIRYTAGLEGHGGSVPGFQTYFILNDDGSGGDGIILMMNLNGIFSPLDSNEYISGLLVKIRNYLLKETGMIPESILFVAVPIAIFGVIVVNLVVYRKKIMGKLGKENN